MEVLVTGGAGYIGSHLVQALQRAGYGVRVLDRRPVDSKLLARGVDMILGSMADPALVARAVCEVDRVCHLAWGFYPGVEWRELQENLLGTLNLLQAALAGGVRHLLFASSAVVYGPTGPNRVSEEHACFPERNTIGGPVYGIAKLACEGLCRVYHRQGLPVTILRLHGVFGPGHLGQFWPMIRQALAGKPVRVILGAGGEYILVGDVLRAFQMALDDPASRGHVFNLAGLHTYAEVDLARYIVDRVGSESELACVEDATQAMISVSVDKLRWILGFEPEGGEFLTGLLQASLQAGGWEAEDG